MTEEIKEMLWKIKRQNIYDDIGYFKTPLSNDDADKLLNYITNLQQENEKLKDNNRKKTKRCTERNHKIRARERIIERRNKKINKLEDYKQRNEKAVEKLKRFDIEYLHETYQHDLANEIEFLLNILEGGDE